MGIMESSRPTSVAPVSFKNNCSIEVFRYDFPEYYSKYGGS